MPGLSIRTQSGKWIDAPAIADAYVVNGGQMLQRWTNDVFLATPHRAINRSGGERYAIPFFCDSNIDWPVAAVPTTVGPDKPPKYPTTWYTDYMVWYQKRNYDADTDASKPPSERAVANHSRHRSGPLSRGRARRVAAHGRRAAFRADRDRLLLHRQSRRARGAESARSSARPRAFHALPLERKMDVRIDRHNVGYLPLRGDTLRTSTVQTVTKANLNEALFVARDLPADHPDVLADRRFRSANRWPADLPGFRETVVAYCDDAGAAGAKAGAALRLRARPAGGLFRRSVHASSSTSCA